MKVGKLAHCTQNLKNHTVPYPKNVSIFLVHDHLTKVVANRGPEILEGNLYHIFHAPPLPTLSLS